MPLPRPLVLAFAVWAGPALGNEVVLNQPGQDVFHASALDQPALDVVLTDPLAGDAVLEGYLPLEEAVGPVIFAAFVDTGASGFAISHLLATGTESTPSLGFEPGDYMGVYTETGVGGAEVGNVSRPFGVRVRNGVKGSSDASVLGEFVEYGDFSLWVRREVGFGEVLDILGFVLEDPINLVGMPVIAQRRMVVYPPTGFDDPLGFPEGCRTELIADADAEPATTVTLGAFLQDFLPDVPPPGETIPSHAGNPMIPGMRLVHGVGAARREAAGTWLYDTGAGSTLVSFALARRAGLIPDTYATLDAYLEDHTGPIAQIGGIGEPKTVPILRVDEIRATTLEGYELVWRGVDVLVLDVAGLDAVFGMNLLSPSVTLDAANPEDFDALFDITPGAFAHSVFDARDPANVQLRLEPYVAPAGPPSWAALHFDAGELADPAVSGDDADPDLDGVENGVERLTGRDPRRAEAGGPLRMAEAGGVLTLRWERIKRPGAHDLVLQRAAAPGGPWTAVPSGEGVWTEESLGWGDAHSVALPGGAGFYRLAAVPVAP